MRPLWLLVLAIPACGRSTPPGAAPTPSTSVVAAAVSSSPPPARRTPEEALSALLDGRPASEVPVLRLEGDAVTVDAKPAGRLAPGPVVLRVEEAYAALRATRDAWRSTHPDKPFPGLVVLRTSTKAPATSWKSLFSTAVRSGFPNVVALFDERADTPFAIEPTIPGGPPGMETAVGAVRIDAARTTLGWAGEAPRDVAASDLPTALCQGWRAHGRHQKDDDRRFDLVDLHLADDASLASLVPLGVAMDACRRPTPAGPRQAFYVRLATGP